jgi:hypothetical protein
MIGGGPKKDKKYVHKIMEQLRKGATELYVVQDKGGIPTYSKDFAKNVKLLIEKGENPRTKPKRVVQVDRTKKGLFKKFRSVSGIGAINGVNDVKKLKQLATSSKSPLLKKVASILASKKTNGGYDTLESVFRDVSRGLQSGIISELIYYSDTTKWYKKYRKEIAKMLMDTMNEMGVDSPSDVFGKNWDTTDPFAEDTQNQNLLAWYSFEETARNISYSLGYEL